MINSTDEAPEIRLVSLNLVYDRPAVWKVIHRLLYIPFCFHFPCIISLTGYTTHYGYGRRPSEKKKPKRRFRSWFTSFCVRRSWWDTIFVVACVIAVSLDPLFFYIPIIDREKKCLEASGQRIEDCNSHFAIPHGYHSDSAYYLSNSWSCYYCCSLRSVGCPGRIENVLFVWICWGNNWQFVMALSLNWHSSSSTHPTSKKIIKLNLMVQIKFRFNY